MYIKVLKFFGIVFIVLFELTGCNQDVSDLGSDFVDTRSNMAFIDSVSVQVSTFKFDSVPTSGRNVIMCGMLDDSNYGKVIVNSFFQVGVPNIKYVNSDIYSYDSTNLVLQYNDNIVGDTTKNYEIKVGLLKQSPEYANNDYNIYSTRDYPDSTLGYVNFKPRPKLKDTLFIKLSDVFGKGIYEKLNNGKDDKIIDKNQLLNYIKGISIRSGTSNSILGYKCTDGSTPSLRVYFHKTGDTISNYSEFNLTNPNLQFNQFKSSITQNYPNHRQLVNSGNTNNSALMLSGVGVCIKLEFPYIQKLKEISKFYRIMSASLIIEPLIRTYNYSNPIPSQMVLSQTDGNNEIGSAIMSPTSNSEPSYGNLGTLDFLNPENNKYNYDITSYIYYLLSKSNSEGIGLLFHSPNFYTSLDRIIIGDQFNSFKYSRTYLKIYYLYYAE